jgi:hypothetical protein
MSRCDESVQAGHRRTRCQPVVHAGLLRRQLLPNGDRAACDENHARHKKLSREFHGTPRMNGLIFPDGPAEADTTYDVRLIRRSDDTAIGRRATRYLSGQIDAPRTAVELVSRAVPNPLFFTPNPGANPLTSHLSEPLWTLTKGCHTFSAELRRRRKHSWEVQLSHDGVFQYWERHPTRARALEEAVACRRELEQKGWNSLHKFAQDCAGGDLPEPSA